MKVKPLDWAVYPPIGLEGDPGDIYALGVGGHYCIKDGRTLFWVDDPFTWEDFRSEAEAKSAAQSDHQERVLSLLTP